MNMSGFPELDRYLLGDNPFTGVNHLSLERARETSSRLNTMKILEVVESALDSGAGGLLFSTHPIIYSVLRRMKEQSDDRTFGVYPLLPYAQSYVRKATEKGMMGLAKEILSELSWKSKAKAFAAAGLSLATMDPARVLNTYVDTELEILSKNTPKGAILKTVLLHEVITDLAVSFNAHELLNDYATHVRDEYHVKPGFATRNFSKFVEFAEKNNFPLDQIIILAPFNKAGFQMNPSKEECERTLNSITNANIIAMSILAAGFIDLPTALEYLTQYSELKSFVVGVSSKTHAKETFPQLHARLG